MIRDVCLPAYENEEQTFESLSSKALLMDWMGEIDDVGLEPAEPVGQGCIYPAPPPQIYPFTYYLLCTDTPRFLDLPTALTDVVVM